MDRGGQDKLTEKLVRKFFIRNMDEAIQLFGKQDAHLKMIEETFQVQMVTRESEVVLTGKEEDVTTVEKLLKQLLLRIRSGQPLEPSDVMYAIRMIQENGGIDLMSLASDAIVQNTKGKAVQPKTKGQQAYVQCIRQHTLTFGVGPAGTGKTYLAIAMAVAALRNREVNRIVLTRPAVEAGEKLGFLPGDLQAKIDPYLRPLYDALYDIMGMEQFLKYVEKGTIEVAPLAYMRGRTLDNSFIILDEAQNTTPEQMKMFLTRLGFGSQAIVTGDITQIDLPQGKSSGLKQAVRILKGVKDVGIVYFSAQDVVRHALVQRIINAYERHNH